MANQKQLTKLRSLLDEFMGQVSTLNAHHLTIDKTIAQLTVALGNRVYELGGDAEKLFQIGGVDSPYSKDRSLTEGQQAAYEKILRFIKEGESTYFRLTGYAGTGKSYLISLIIQHLHQSKISYIAASPTCKAAKNLAKIAAANKINLLESPTTVAKLLGLQPSIELETGKQIFSNDGEIEIRLGEYRLIIIDEFSMLTTENFKQLQREIQETGGSSQVLLVGDSMQLPPVGEREPIVAIHKDITSTAELTQIVRYDGEIARVAEDIRSNKKWNSLTYPFQTTQDGTIVKLEKRKWLPKIAELLASEEAQDPDLVRVIAWRNATVDSWNKAIRVALHGENVPQFVIGDRLIARKPVFRTLPGGKKKDKFIILNNSEECLVSSEPRLYQEETKQWDYWELNVVSEEGFGLNLRILTEEAEAKRQEELKKLSKEAIAEENSAQKKVLWKKYYELDGLFDNMTYAYALTCHKAQGSSIDHVFLLASDMTYCSDKQKMLYTALTRTKKCCYVG